MTTFSDVRSLLRSARLFVLGSALVVGAVAVSAGAASPQRSGDLPEYHPEEPDAPAVTEESLLENDGFWPYRVALTRDWAPAVDEDSLSEGVIGVLVRVEPGGTARIDFGRDGVHEVPIGATDVVERANAVRLGERDKLAPNFVHAIGPRLVDSSGEQPRNEPFEEVYEPKAFLAVFADPSAEGFAELARALAPLQEREGLATILFAQGRHPAEELHAKLAELDWRIAHVFDHMAEGYTRSLRSSDRPLPELMLQTPDGRVLHRSAWSARSGEEGEASLAGLRTALEDFLGSAPATAAAPAPEEP